MKTPLPGYAGIYQGTALIADVAAYLSISARTVYRLM